MAKRLLHIHGAHNLTLKRNSVARVKQWKRRKKIKIVKINETKKDKFDWSCGSLGEKNVQESGSKVQMGKQYVDVRNIEKFEFDSKQKERIEKGYTKAKAKI